jgi:endonuclease YncB( thermonuclease family)
MRRHAPLVVLAAVTILVAPFCSAQERISGRAKITDGDSFEIGATTIRLYGIDAPEGRQPCTRDEREWRCGDAAAAELRRLVGQRSVVCVRRDEDDYGRMVAVCHSGSKDLGAAMVSAGLALAYRRYSTDYVDEENDARRARRGVWAGEITPPWEWRRQSRD